MANRPCRPDADLKHIWQMLLPGMQFPACGVAEKHDACPKNSQGQTAFKQNCEYQSPEIAILITLAATLLSSIVNGAAVKANFTLFRTPSQPVAPLNALDFTD